MRIITVFVVGILSSGCAPGMYGVAPRPYAPAIPSARPVDVIGRWDNVMMLAPGSRVLVLLLDGSRVDGTVVSATDATFRVAAGGSEIALDAGKIARVDRSGSSERIRRGLSGALHGAGAVGLLGLLSGHTPPARSFAAAAVVGAEVGHHSVDAPGGRTVYIARKCQ